METILGMLAFFALMIAQVLAVIFVHHDHAANEATRRRPISDEARTWNIWLSA